MKHLLLYALLVCCCAAQAQPRILAHRGGRAEQEENTLSAFKATYEAGCHGFETDIHITADGDYVVMHDFTLSRMTNGEGKIEESKADYIRTLSTKKGQKVLFLDELVGYFKTCSSLYVEFEMKTNPEVYPEALLHKYCDEIHAKIMGNKPQDALYVFSSFDTRPLLYMQSRYPDAELMLITGKPCCRETVDLCLALGLHRLAATIAGTSRDAVKYAHEKGLKVNLWPGNTTAATHLAALLGADYLCTDIPQQVMRYIDENHLDIQSK